jgi:sugar lactone lactonase YvrE
MGASPELQVLLDGLAFVETPRWHDGRLWFAHWGRDEVLAVDLDGRSEVVAPGSAGMGWAIDWLPDGRLLVTGETLRRREPDGTFVVHADLSGIFAQGSGGEIVVDRRGNAYVNSIEFDFLGGGAPDSGLIALVRPDGAARQVADGLAFPNGMALTPDGATLIVAESFGGCLTAFSIEPDGGLSGRRTWADLGDAAPDGICLDADGAVWFADVPHQRAVRVREGGEILATIELDRGGFACALGGPTGHTLFILAADWPGPDAVADQLPEGTGRIYTTPVQVPAAPAP